MNGERETALDSGAGDERIFARPAWLEEFSGPRGGPPHARAPDRTPGPATDEWRSEADPSVTPPERGGRADDDLWDEEPTGWRATVDRVRTTPRAALALVAVGVIGAIVAAVAVFGSSGGAQSGQYPVVDFAGAGSSSGAASRAAPSRPGAATSSTPAAPTELVVAVVGLVRAPGLHRLPPGSRIADALDAARGAIKGADTAGLNLAQPLRDGDQIVVGVVDQKAGVKLRSAVLPSGAGAASGNPGTPGASAPSGAPAGAVNINTANATELDRLPGVGAATAAAIIAYRDENGPFASVDDLAKVSGIGDAKLARIKPMATV